MTMVILMVSGVLVLMTIVIGMEMYAHKKYTMDVYGSMVMSAVTSDPNAWMLLDNSSIYHDTLGELRKVKEKYYLSAHTPSGKLKTVRISEYYGEITFEIFHSALGSSNG